MGINPDEMKTIGDIVQISNQYARSEGLKLALQHEFEDFCDKYDVTPYSSDALNAWYKQSVTQQQVSGFLSQLV